MSKTTSVQMEGACPHCSSNGQQVMHTGKCPKVASVEYHRNGMVKKVTFHPTHLPLEPTHERTGEDDG